MKIQSKLKRYGIAIGAVALATLIRLALLPAMGEARPMFTYLFAVLFIAWYCGSGPTLLAVFLSMVSATYFVLSPRNSFEISVPTDQVGLLIFLSLGLVITLLSEQLFRARERGEWRQLQRENELALMDSERRFRQLADSMPQMVWTVGPDGMTDYYNERWYVYTGLAPEARDDESWKPAFHPDDIDKTQAAWNEARQSGHDFQVEYRLRDCRTGEYRWHLGRAVPARDEAGKIAQWFGTSTDIDDQKRVEEKLQEAYGEMELRVKERTLELTEANQNIRRLAAQLASAEDTERRRLASDLHDSIGQSLSLLKLNLEPMADRLAGNPESRSGLAASLQTLDEIIKQTRTLMFELYPSMLHDLGLVPTLLWYGEQLQAQAQVIVSEIGAARPLEPPLASYLFRAVKEVLGNAVRHGRAREIFVTVHWRQDALKIVIDDDGNGFNPVEVLAPQTQHGLGLAGIEERLVSFKGKMSIESEPEQGARVILEVPLCPDHLSNSCNVGLMASAQI